MRDNEIVNYIWNRDQDGIRLLQEKYDNYLHTISYNILGDPNDVDECVNDAWVKVWNCIPPEKPDNLKAFVGKICRNQSINRLRDASAIKRGSGEVTIILDELSDVWGMDAGSEEFFESLALRELINQFLKSLSEEERNVFVCRYFYLDSIASIAGFANCSESRIKSMLLRMRKRLKKCLIKEGYNEWG